MASIYVPVRLAQLIISAIVFIYGVIALVQELDGIYDSTKVAFLSITVIVIFLGLYGSYKHDRTYLITFALILLIAILTGFFAKSIPYGNLGTCIVLLVLSLTQAELIKRGYH